jgi:hypothetical protein
MADDQEEILAAGEPGRLRGDPGRENREQRAKDQRYQSPTIESACFPLAL